MAYIPNTDEPQPGSNTVTPGAAGTQLAPASGVGSAPAGPSATNPTGAGGQFATLQSYLTANQGQAAPLANKITSGIGQQYNTLQGQNAATLGGIQGQVAQGATPLDQNVLAQEAANPVSFASNPSNIQSFQKQLNAQYTGPQSAEGTSAYQKQQNAINSAIATGQAQTGTEAGREQLLQQTEARPTTGVTALNSAILTQSPDYLSKVQNAYQPFSNLLSGLSSGAADVNKQIAQNQAQAQQASQQASQQIQGQAQGLQTNLQSELANAQAATDAYNQGLQQWQTGVAANQPFNAALQQSGLLPLLGVANPFTVNYQAMNAPTMAQVATPEQAATDQALAQLAGPSYNPIFTPAQAVQAGTYQAPGALPAAPNIQNLMNQLALADVPQLNNLGLGSPFPATTNPVDASRYLELVGPPTQFSPAQFAPTYNQYVAPFQNLLSQLNQIYGSKYTQPLTFRGNPVSGEYELAGMGTPSYGGLGFA